MTTQFTTDPTDQFRKTSSSVKEQRRLVSFWRVVLPAAGALAVIGVAASAYQFAGSPDGAPRPIALNAQANIAVVDKPVPMTRAAPPAQTAKQRAARIEIQERPEPEIAALQDDDPRWGPAPAAGETGETAVPEPIETTELRSKLERLRDPAGEAAVASAANEPEPTDATFTGTISPRAESQPTPVAEAVAVDQAAPPEAVAVDQPAPDAEAVAAASATQDEPEPVVAEAGAPAAGSRSAKVTTHVNMRAGPENEAAVLTVVPAGGSVKVLGCEMWCEIDFDGRRGWVYKSFIAGS